MLVLAFSSERPRKDAVKREQVTGFSNLWHRPVSPTMFDVSEKRQLKQSSGIDSDTDDEDALVISAAKPTGKPRAKAQKSSFSYVNVILTVLCVAVVARYYVSLSSGSGWFASEDSQAFAALASTDADGAGASVDGAVATTGAPETPSELSQLSLSINPMVVNKKEFSAAGR